MRFNIVFKMSLVLLQVTVTMETRTERLSVVNRQPHLAHGTGGVCDPARGKGRVEANYRGAEGSLFAIHATAPNCLGSTAPFLSI
jgi:hypothetical protein